MHIMICHNFRFDLSPYLEHGSTTTWGGRRATKRKSLLRAYRYASLFALHPTTTSKLSCVSLSSPALSGFTTRRRKHPYVSGF
jgi:hypothetical protein